jgi:hypothetical protein
MTLCFEADLGSIKYTESDGEVRTLSASDKSVLLAMADCAADDGSSVFLGVERLTWKTELSERAVRESLRHLRLAEALIITKSSSQHHPTHYRINVALTRGARRAGLDDEPEVQQPQVCKPRGAAGAARPAPGAPNPSENHQRTTNHQEHPAPPTADAIPLKTPGAVVFEAYSSAYKVRHGVEPTRGHRSNSICKDLASRVSVEEAAGIASYYVSSTERLYEAAKHPLTLLARDFDKFRTEFLTGQRPVVPTPASPKTAGRVQAILQGVGRHVGPPNSTCPVRPALEERRGALEPQGG